MKEPSRSRGIIGVGYEGQGIDAFIGGLLTAGTQVLADVRLNPVSRKRGFSKRLLAASLAEAGIDYWHVPELGNLKWNRDGFSGSRIAVRRARLLYSSMITGNEAQACLDEIAAAARDDVVAVMCVEANEEACHRYVVLRELERRLKLSDAVVL